MPPLLKRDGKFVKKGDKLVRSDDPANCSCCNVCPCLADPIDIVSTALKDEGEDIRVEWVVQWNVPQECDIKYDFEFEYLNQDGKLLGRSNTPATVGQSTHYYNENKEDACSDPAKRTAKIRGRVIDLQDNCAPSPWAEKDVGPYDDICPPPEDCRCIVPPRALGFRLEPNPAEGQITVLVSVEWLPPEDCWQDGSHARRVMIEAEFLNEAGNVVSGMANSAVIGVSEFGYGQPTDRACEDANRAAKVRVRAVDSLGICPPTDWSPEVGLSAGSPTYEDLCPPPPDGYICQGPFSGIWECAPCNDCAGQEVYATMEECQAACQPPPEECCLVCEIPPPPPEKCPDGFFVSSNGLCHKYFPTDCSDGQIADAAQQCSAAGGAAVGKPDGPCPEPPGCDGGEAVFEWQMVTPTMSRWTLVWETCTISGCDPYNWPTDPGSFFGERKTMPCLPRARKNPPSFKKAAPPQPSGPGTELKKLLGRIGITATPTCECNKKAAVMDFHGPKWCRDNLEMLVGWLREEAQKRRLPFSDIVGRHLLKYAIRQAEKKRVTGEGEGHK